MKSWTPSNDKEPNERVRFTLVSERGLRCLLEAAAKASDRSLSGEAVHRIRRTFADETRA